MMPICQPCANAAHDRCEDTQHPLRYRDCYCQHGRTPVANGERGKDGQPGQESPSTTGLTRIQNTARAQVPRATVEMVFTVSGGGSTANG